jgi:hypothetical protein
VATGRQRGVAHDRDQPAGQRPPAQHRSRRQTHGGGKADLDTSDGSSSGRMAGVV